MEIYKQHTESILLFEKKNHELASNFKTGLNYVNLDYLHWRNCLKCK